jgi:hypothetical protein
VATFPHESPFCPRLDGLLSVPTLTGRVLFVLVLIAHHRRRLVHVTITEHPTAEWTASRTTPASAPCAYAAHKTLN